MLLNLSCTLPNVIEISSVLVVLIDLVLGIGKREAAVVLLMDIAVVHKATSTVVQNLLSILVFNFSEVVKNLSHLLFIGGNSLIEKK